MSTEQTTPETEVKTPSSRDAARAAVLAEMTAEAPAVEVPAAESAPEATEVETPEAKPEPVEAATKADDGEADEVLDPEAAKRIASVQRAEKRSRELLAKERAEIAELKASIERERKEIASQLDEVKGFANLKARARYAPAEVLAALGLTEDDFEPAARELYTRSKAGAQDPRNKEAALKMQRDREYQDKVSQLEAKLEAVQKQFTEKEQQAKYEQAWQGYYSDVVKAASAEASESPLLKTAMTKNPAKTQKAVQQLAAQIFQDTGEWPDAQDVIVTYEKNRRQELEELGIDLGAVKPEPATEKKVSKTVSPTAKAGTPVKTKKSMKEEREETLRMLESGRLE